MTAEPATKGYEVSRFEVRQFMRALALDPDDVDSVRIVAKRVVATLLDGSTIHVRITDPRGGTR